MTQGEIADEQDEFGFPETREGAGRTILPSVLDAFTQFRSQIRYTLPHSPSPTLLYLFLLLSFSFPFPPHSLKLIHHFRQAAKDKKESEHFLRLCDTLRDEVLPRLGVRFEDSGDFPWKLVSKEDIQKEKEAKRQEAKDKLFKSKQAVDSEIERWVRISVSPSLSSSLPLTSSPPSLLLSPPLLLLSSSPPSPPSSSFYYLIKEKGGAK